MLPDDDGGEAICDRESLPWHGPGSIPERAFRELFADYYYCGTLIKMTGKSLVHFDT